MSAIKRLDISIGIYTSVVAPSPAGEGVLSLCNPLFLLYRKLCRYLWDTRGRKLAGNRLRSSEEVRFRTYSTSLDVLCNVG